MRRRWGDRDWTQGSVGEEAGTRQGAWQEEEVWLWVPPLGRLCGRVEAWILESDSLGLSPGSSVSSVCEDRPAGG